ncbi:MAG: hypothetical protein FWC73_12685 [Defluviitaleaceae bacterium]|nr:hypothetical protein [Defluviitaleaceae bacterium]
MDRVPYRRVTPPRHERPHSPIQNHDDEPDNEAAISRGEALIMQCILSAIIFAVVLVASFVDIAPAVTVRNGIQQVLTGAETLDELVLDIRQFGAEWFGWDAPETPYAHDYSAPGYEFFEDLFRDQEQTAVPYEEPQDAEPLTYDMYYEYLDSEEQSADELSNPTVPEPPTTPGLWD